ncbi:MAG: ATP-binding protein [Nitrosopumilus sp.]|nr:ATP-binding protein [Nitrosopumilus sp.]MDH3855816.1 ATP-binding protein [Nitrosopumilus sp.]
MTVILICGLPGVGKSAISKKLASRLKAVVLSTDKIRKELIKNPTYNSKEKKQIYDIMILLAKYLHEANIPCILDATFSKDSFRKQVKKKIGISGSQFQVVECICPEKLIISRLKSRKNDYSDADVPVYKKMKKIYESVKGKHIQVNTEVSADINAKLIHQKILEDGI